MLITSNVHGFKLAVYLGSFMSMVEILWSKPKTMDKESVKNFVCTFFEYVVNNCAIKCIPNNNKEVKCKGK